MNGEKTSLDSQTNDMADKFKRRNAGCDHHSGRIVCNILEREDANKLFSGCTVIYQNWNWLHPQVLGFYLIYLKQARGLTDTYAPNVDDRFGTSLFLDTVPGKILLTYPLQFKWI